MIIMPLAVNSTPFFFAANFFFKLQTDESVCACLNIFSLDT